MNILILGALIGIISILLLVVGFVAALISAALHWFWDLF